MNKTHAKLHTILPRKAIKRWCSAADRLRELLNITAGTIYEKANL